MLAYVLIAYSGSAAFFGIVLNVLFHVVLPKEQMMYAFRQAESAGKVSSLFSFVANNYSALLVLFLIAAIGAFVSASFLHRQKEWSKTSVYTLLIISIFSWTGIALSAAVFTGGQGQPPEVEGTMLVVKIAMMTVWVMLIAVFVFFMEKLFSCPTKTALS